MLLSGIPADAKEKRVVSAARGCPDLVRGVYYYRNATHKWEQKLNKTWTKSTFNASKIRSCAYTKWVAHRWMRRAHKERVSYVQRLRQHTRQLQSIYSDPRAAICSVFGRYCDQALSVAECESGFNIYAANGQYENIFQMGYEERKTYGWHTKGSPAIVASRAAYRYFVDVGMSWSPWSCQP